ncbi:Protein FAM13B [Cricetulus griseus]|uniref:Protein FAM13B n=1 Tax=Cricetulus griseus TaxID=10029 RepID=G3HF02_CRIGR|nr:Protein FAM13B [Cricetulus griseus]
MRKSSSPSLSNCNSDLANKIFGIPLDELQQGGHPDNEVPFIVRHVVDYIEEHGGLEQQGLFQVNGNAETVEWLRQRYDSGEEVDLVKEADVPSAISLLRFFLQELPEPVIPGSWHIHLMQLSQDYNNEDEFGRKLRFLLQQLPPVNYSLLKFLCRFLANVASHHEEIWSANSLAAVFGPDVFHIYTDVEDMKEQEIVSRIMAGLLENYYEFFENEEEDFSSNDLSSITEQVNELSEEEEEDEKLEHIEELPEEGVEKSDGMPEGLQLRMTENVLEPDSVTASARVDAAADSADASDGNIKCSKPVAGTTTDNEVMQQDFIFEDQKNNQSVGILLEPCSDHGDSEDGCLERKEYLLCDSDKLPHLILDSSSKIRDLNANTESEVTDSQSVGVQGEAACIQVAHLDLKNVSDGDKWEDHEDEENEGELRVIQKEKKPSKEATLELITKRLKENRAERHLPEDIKVTREERHIVKPLYDICMLVKQMLTRASITPILEEEEDGVSLSSELSDILKTAVHTQSSLENSESDAEENQEKLALDLRLSSTRAASMPELLEQLWKARAEKKKLRKTLREFEEAFYQQNGRNAQKEDRVPVLEEYKEYKKIKAKLRLLEVLISKQDSSKSI